MIFELPVNTKSRLTQLNSDINRLLTIRQSIIDTVCDAHSYTGAVKFTADDNLETIEESK